MRFKIHRDHLTSGLAQVLNVVGARPTMPILRNVLIEAGNGMVTLTTTNLDMGIRCSIRAEVEESGGLTLPVRKLALIVRELPSLEIFVETDAKHYARISSGASVFKILGLGQDDFPPLAQFDQQERVKIPQSKLLRMLKSVSYAQSADDNRPILNGVYFHRQSKQLTVVATDGRRLATAREEISDFSEDGLSQFTLPSRTVGELERLLGQGAEVALSSDERQVAFEILLDEGKADNGLIESIYLVSKIVEGKYPDYQQVIPRETEHRVKVERELMQDGVHRASLVVSEKSSTLKLRFAQNLLEINGESSEYGESHETLAIAYEGPETRIAFNAQYLIDPLRCLGSDEVFFEFKDEMSPGVFKTLDNHLCVVMPLRLN
ncbi:MAG: DNA polymerase III subunit beta [Puniceicoccaceae bacterium]